MNKVPFQGKRTLLLLHGPAIKFSRLRLTAIKQKFVANNVVVYESGASIQEIMGGLMTIPLLVEPRLIILENPPEDIIFDSLTPGDFLTLLLWFDHEVGEKKPVMEWVKKSKGQIFYFPESREVSVFPFLDYLAGNDQKAYLELEKLKKAGFDIQYFLTMVCYLLRTLVVTPKTAPQFVKDKLIRQRKNFSLERIIKLYQDVLEIDFKIKAGLLEKPQAEFLLVFEFLGH